MSKTVSWFTLYITLIGGNWVLYHGALPVRIAHHIILTVFLVWWLLKRGLPDTPMILPITGMLVAMTLSSVNAIDRRMALEYGWHWVTNWILLLYLIDVLRAGQAGNLFKAIFASGALVALSCILEWLMSGGRPSGLFGIINLTGAYLAALIVPAIGWLMAVTKLRHRQLLILFIVMAGVAIILNQSRGALLSVVVALTVFGALNIKRLSVLQIAIGVGWLSLLISVPIVMSMQSGHMAGDLIRGDLWAAGVDMADQNQTGVGVGLFAQAYHQRAVSEDRFTGAHNYYITLGAEFGGFGLAAAAAFMLTVLYLLIEEKRTIQQNAVLAALLGVMAHMLVDNYPAQNWTYLISLYCAYLVYQVRWTNEPIPTVVSRLAVFGLMLYGLLFGSWDIAQIHYENALRTKNLEEINTAIAIDSHNRLYVLEAERLANPSMLINPNYALTNFARISYE